MCITVVTKTTITYTGGVVYEEMHLAPYNLELIHLQRHVVMSNLHLEALSSKYWKFEKHCITLSKPIREDE